jgi:hypothetical protein
MACDGRHPKTFTIAVEEVDERNACFRGAVPLD